MRTTLALDDDLLATAERYTGLKEKSALVREALPIRWRLEMPYRVLPLLPR